MHQDKSKMKKTTESKKNQAHSEQHKAVRFERRYFTPNNLKANNGQIDGVPANPRFIRDNKYKKLLESMQQDPDFLEIREIAVYDMGEGAATDERFVCIGGNMRYRAAKQLGWKTVPCKIARLCGGKHFAHSGKAVRSDGMVMDVGADHAFSCRCGPA